MKKFIKVYAIDVPKKVPPDAKLYTKFVGESGIDKNLKWVEREYYQVSFRFKEGILNEGFHYVSAGNFACSTFFGSKSIKLSIANEIKNFGKGELKKIHMVTTYGFFNLFLVEMAVRSVLSNHYGFKKIYDGFPFASKPWKISYKE